MAQTIVYTDDLNDEPGAEPVHFAIDGTAYVIDLADKNAERLRSFLAEFVSVARVETAGAEPPRRARGKQGGAFGYNPATVREWWKGNEESAGRAYNDKGRIPETVVDAWQSRRRGA